MFINKKSNDMIYNSCQQMNVNYGTSYKGLAILLQADTSNGLCNNCGRYTSQEEFCW